MNETIKKIMLQECHNFDIPTLLSFINKNEISLEEFIEVGLDNVKVKELKAQTDIVALKRKEEEERLIKEEKEKSRLEKIILNKQAILNDIINNEISAVKIKTLIEQNFISIADIDNLPIEKSFINSLKNYLNSDKVIQFYNISQLPRMQDGNTDVFFIGLARAGKTTMLTSLLQTATNQSRYIPVTNICPQGEEFSNTICENIERGFIPPATASGSFIYIPLKLIDNQGSEHPINFLDVPGEIFEDHKKNDLEEFIKYIDNGNKKIVFIVADSISKEEKTGSNQVSIYSNIIQKLEAYKMVNNIEAIYIVANKFDYLLNNDYANDSRTKGQIADEYIINKFGNVLANCKNIRNQSNYKFKIRTLPFSIGDIKWNSIINKVNEEYSNQLIEILLADSFVKSSSSRVSDKFFKIFR